MQLGRAHVRKGCSPGSRLAACELPCTSCERCQQVLHSVTLGMARAEIDYLVCLPRPAGGGVDGAAGAQESGAVTTLDAVAMCEVKRDSSDLGFAVSKSAETMTWLAGEHVASVARLARPTPAETTRVESPSSLVRYKLWGGVGAVPSH